MAVEVRGLAYCVVYESGFQISYAFPELLSAPNLDPWMMSV